MSQCGIRAKLCAGKISIDSSIQAQRPGDFMRRKWRSYALFDKIEHFQAATGIACESDLTALEGLSESASTQVLHLAREGLTNIARHAQAHHVWIRTREDLDRLEIEVGDDGFNLATAEGQSGHYGLLGLRERARLLGGAVEIRSMPGEGMVLSFSLPNLKRRGDMLDEYSKQGHSSRHC
jgi:two-component system, NarL family, sensor histidine kinase YdfH